MNRPSGLDQLERRAKLAMAKMVELGIPVTSTNYMVWYSYYAESHPNLKEEIDALIDSGQSFSESLSEQLYAKFFGLDEQGAALRTTMSDLENLVGRMVSFVSEAHSKTFTYGKLLGDAKEELRRDTDTMSGDVIDRMKQETLQMAKAFKTVESRLAESADQLTQLGDDLRVIEQPPLQDGLTGIANWQAFHDALRRCAIEAAGMGSPVSLLMINLDHFGQFNERHGRPMGDKVLALVARLLTEKTECPSIAARYSGDEFAVILKATKLTEALTQANVIRETLASHEFTSRSSGARFGQVTISIGVSEYGNGEPLAHFIQRTRAALQSAKDQGRNCVATEDVDSHSLRTDADKRRAS